MALKSTEAETVVPAEDDDSSSLSLGIDNICLNIDKYLDDLEKSMDMKSSSVVRRSSSFGFPSTSTSDDKNWSSTVSKKSERRLSLGNNDLNKKDTEISDNNDAIDNIDEIDSENKHLQLIWRNLTYMATAENWSNSCITVCGQNIRKVILDRQSGGIYGGQLTAIIGPSGAGKSTLLESLAGRRRKGLRGEILVVYDSDYIERGSRIKVAFIGQKDHVIEVLTVRETLLFATQLKNYNRIQNRYYHQRLVNSILKELNLEICADVRVSKISGGQLKRLSFGIELISGPDILMLDEPTSGLDSSSAFQCILLLRKLTDLKNKELSCKPPAIICSIHQPSARVLNIFHQIYVLSYDGRCLYQGSPYALLSHLSRFNLHCPHFHNPADYIIEIASGDYGLDPINKLAIAECNREIDILNEEKMLLSCSKFIITSNPTKMKQVRVPISKVIEKLKKQPFPYFRHTWLLLKRTYFSTIRDPKLTWFRISQAIFIGLLMSYLYDYPIGEADGCLPTATNLNNKEAVIVPTLAGTQDNISFIFFITLFTVMASMMPTVLTFPSEVAVLIQERNNGWYSCWVYYWTKVLADSPYQILITIMFCCIIYPMTGQIHSYWRFAMFNFIMILVATIAQCVGMLFGTLYVKSVQNAVFMAPLSMAPMFLLSGFFGKISKIPIVMKPIAYSSYVKYAFEALIVTFYGYDRCPQIGDLQTVITSEISLEPSESNNELITSNHYSQFNEEARKPTKFWQTIPKYASTFPKIWSGYYNPLTYPLNDTSVEESVQETKLNSSSTSLILKHFEVDDDTLIQNICILIFILILLRLNKPEELKGVVGVNDLEKVEANNEIFFDRVIVHSNYTVGPERELINDIALLHVNKPIDFSSQWINSICLPKRGETSYKAADVTGWGQTEEHGFSTNILQTAVVYPFREIECVRRYKKKYHRKEMLCAGLRRGGRDACRGDSGGPLTQSKGSSNYLIGIVSFGVGCARKDFPGMYTRVSNYVDWINKHIGQ
ncbi:ABC transporter-like protein 12 [Dinothrombium tinctorium]|uniref:Vitamin K-dependent protein C n=1 Tax=Dinothrombium tinctorium TaxID=1965070 RepID=A0A3S4R285_9ACAR|nr:ABC transporter-like protein 12 [Dinothrombium tinctorium]RWS10641.1 ABC transporter-like protein 12 [Dinothrombium tinctorium]